MENDMTNRILTVLHGVQPNSPEGHHFGRAFLSSYQIAIRLLDEDPALSDSLNLDVGGRGTGRHVSLAQYIGQNLSRQIKADRHHPVEGVFMSNELVRQVVYRRPGGEDDVVSSLAGTPYDMALFRLREHD
ncbi:MAG: hypothetical protein KDB40_20925 [Acidimicrobiales bacterium]|nr:hypothetical protein [Acidimicrobiales bacterium]